MTAVSDRPTAAGRPSSDGRMPLVGHLRELRNRLAICAVAVAATGSLGWWYYSPLLERLESPIREVARVRHSQLVGLNFGGGGITAPFATKLHVALFVGVVLASPVWLYQLWRFLVPAMRRRERRYALCFIAASLPLFVGGAALAWLVFPKAVVTLLDLTPQGGANITDADAYLSFVTRFVLAFGLAFLIPVLMVALDVAHVLTARRMIRAWRVSVLAICVFAAVMTPTPDPWTMLLMAVPMVALFFVAVGVSALLDRRRTES